MNNIHENDVLAITVKTTAASRITGAIIEGH